jgi:hypothetical protein
LRRQDDPLVEISVFVVGDDGRAFRHETTHATEMIEVVALDSFANLVSRYSGSGREKDPRLMSVSSVPKGNVSPTATAALFD